MKVSTIGFAGAGKHWIIALMTLFGSEKGGSVQDAAKAGAAARVKAMVNDALCMVEAPSANDKKLPSLS